MTKSVLLIGCGAIGKEIIKKLAIEIDIHISQIIRRRASILKSVKISKLFLQSVMYNQFLTLFSNVLATEQSLNLVRTF